MEENGKMGDRTWEDVRTETPDVPEGALPDASPHGEAGIVPPPEGAPHRPPHGEPRKRVGAGRLTVYLLLTVLLNILLAIYSLFILGISVEKVTEILRAGKVESMPGLILLVLIMVTPLLLTIFCNRILYCAMRGRRRFPRGIWLLAALLVVLVQAATIYVAITAGAVPGMETFTVESFTTAAY